MLKDPRFWRTIWPRSDQPLKRTWKLVWIALIWAFIWWIAASVLDRWPLQWGTLVAGLVVAFVFSIFVFDRVDNWKAALWLNIIYAGGLVAWCVLMFLTVLFDGFDYYYEFWLWGWFWIAVWWLALVYTRSWMIEIAPGDVYLRHRARDPLVQFTFLEGSFPVMEQNLDDCVKELYDVLQGLRASPQVLHGLNQQLRQWPDTEKSRQKIRDTVRQIRQEITKPEILLKDLPDSEPIKAFLQDLLNSPEIKPAKIAKSGDGQIRRTYEWVRPSDDVWLLWKKTDLVWLKATYPDIPTSDGVPFGLTVKFACTFNPSRVRTPEYKMNIPHLRPIDKLKENIQLLLDGAVEQQANSFFASLDLQSAVTTGITLFWNRIPELLRWTDTMLGITIQSWSILCGTPTNDELRHAADRLRAARANTKADQAPLHGLVEIAKDKDIPHNLLMGLMFFDQSHASLRFPPQFGAPLSADRQDRLLRLAEAIEHAEASGAYPKTLTGEQQHVLDSRINAVLAQSIQGAANATPDLTDGKKQEPSVTTGSPLAEPSRSTSLPATLRPKAPGDIADKTIIEGHFREISTDVEDEDLSGPGLPPRPGGDPIH